MVGAPEKIAYSVSQPALQMSVQEASLND
jgi:hypothetical protein